VASDQPLYLDACATTPLVRAARRAMEQAQAEAWGNPSSLHGFGLSACESLERSRQQVAELLGAAADAVHFCSGATESVHLALLGVAAAEQQPGRLLLSAVEHPAVNAAADQLRRGGWDVVSLPVDHNGQVLLEPLQTLLASPTRLVSVIAAQSEVGSVQPIEAIGRLCRDAGVLFHTDAVQLVPHQRLDFSTAPIDLLTCTAHKLGGPRGIGALLVQPACRQRMAALLGGGMQEQGLRAGTEPVVLAAGFAAALHQPDHRNSRPSADSGSAAGARALEPGPGRQQWLGLQQQLPRRRGQPRAAGTGSAAGAGCRRAAAFAAARQRRCAA
jgi:cysteine desulfurase